MSETPGVPVQTQPQPEAGNPPGAPPSPTSVRPPAVDAWGDTVRARAAKLQAMVDKLLLELDTDPDSTPRERSKVMHSAAQTLGLIGRITGESQDLPEAKLLKLPALRRVQDRIVEALSPWPDALRAVGEALQEMGTEK